MVIIQSKMEYSSTIKKNWLLLILIPIVIFECFIIWYGWNYKLPSNDNLALYNPVVSEIKEDLKPIVVYGDSRTGHDIHEKVVGAILEFEPIAVFHTGDLVDDGTDADQWETFNEITSDLLEITDFYPALGNHERNSDLYYSSFELPGNEQWYSVDVNNIHFIILDSDVDLSIDSEQYEWLGVDIKGITDDIEFIVAIFHHPPFSTGPHEEDEKGLRESIVPLFEEYEVDIVFSGHDHSYERSLYNGIYYIVAGGGGAPLYDQERTSAVSQKFLKSYNFCVIEVEEDKLNIDVYDEESVLIDTFEV